MAGVKGKSGGPRANSGGPRANSGGARANAGGARPGAGRPPKDPDIVDIAAKTDDPDEFLRAVQVNELVDIKIRVDAAKARMRFHHAAKGEGGKKDEKTNAAKKVAGRFAQSAPPRLAAAGGKKVG
jgi:phage terminase small subunit